MNFWKGALLLLFAATAAWARVTSGADVTDTRYSALGYGAADFGYRSGYYTAADPYLYRQNLPPFDPEKWSEQNLEGQPVGYKFIYQSIQDLVDVFTEGGGAWGVTGNLLGFLGKYLGPILTRRYLPAYVGGRQQGQTIDNYARLAAQRYALAGKSARTAAENCVGCDSFQRSIYNEIGKIFDYYQGNRAQTPGQSR